MTRFWRKARFPRYINMESWAQSIGNEDLTSLTILFLYFIEIWSRQDTHFYQIVLVRPVKACGPPCIRIPVYFLTMRHMNSSKSILPIPKAFNRDLVPFSMKIP